MNPRDNHALRPDPEPTDELLLAQSLDTCLRAESVLSGSSEAIVARVPDPARTELAALLATARLVESAAASATPSPEFKAAARARLMRKISTNGEEPTQPTPIVLASIAGRARGPARRRWLLRGLGGLAAAGLTAAATLTASANALPGEPLYPVKQAKEEVAVRMAADDQARALALVQRANARLDETTRLLQQGRTDDALQAAEQYDQSVDRATSTLIAALGPQPGTSPAAEQFAVALAEQQVQLENVLPDAPAEAQAELREALQTTERGRALAANPAPVKQALAQPVVPTQAQPALAAPRLEPTADTADTAPSEAPTSTPLAPPAVVAHEPEPEPEAARAEEVRSDDRGGPYSAADALANRGSGEDQRSGGEDQRSGGPGPQAAPRVTIPVQPARPAVQQRRNTSGPGPSDDGANDRGGNAEQRGSPGSGNDEQRGAPAAAADDQSGGPASVAEDQHAGPSGGDDQRGSPAVANDQRGGPSGGDDQRGGGDDDRRGGDTQQQAQPQLQPTQGPPQPAGQVARGQDGGGDSQRGGGQNGQAGQNGQSGQGGQNGQNSQAGAAVQSGSGDASAATRATTAPATTAPVVPPTPSRGDDGGGQTPGRGDDQAAVRPGVQQQPTTVQQQPTRPPTATPTRQQNTPQPTQAPAQTQNPNRGNNNRAPATTTTTNRNDGGRSGSDDGSSGKGGGR